MARDAKHDILFEPVRIGPKTLRNRFYQVPHCTGYGTQKPGSQAAHRGMKAEGGWAAVCTEYAPVSADSDESPYVSSQLLDEDDLANLAVMTEAAHEHGALAGIELAHTGVHAPSARARWPAIAPSQIASDYDPFLVPKAMELDDIRRVQADWALAARRSRDAGFDIVYVYGGHSYLLTQFLSPFYNKRTDAYGGSLENRARMWIETLDVVRDAVGDDCAIAVRIGVDLTPGLEVDEALEFVRLADHLVDLWDVNVGSIAEWSLDSGASRFFGEGYQLEWTGRVREATSKPIVGVGRFTNPDRMAEVIRSGAWDLIGAARPSIADPFLPRKVEEGRYGEVRECIGCNVCISKSETGHHLGCTQNATAGEEYRRGWHPERFEPAANADRDVLVVGAGAGGHGVRDRPRQARDATRAPGRCGARDRRGHALDSHPARARGVGPRRQLATHSAREAEERRGRHRRRAGRSRRARVRGGDRHRGDGRALVGERPERPHARAAAGRGRDPAPRAHPGAGHGRGQAAARGAGGGLRRRGVLHGCAGSPSSSRRRAGTWSS